MILTIKHLYYYDIVRLGPSLNPRPRAWFGPKENTKMGLHTHHHHPPHKLFNHFQSTQEVQSQYIILVLVYESILIKSPPP